MRRVPTVGESVDRLGGTTEVVAEHCGSKTAEVAGNGDRARSAAQGDSPAGAAVGGVVVVEVDGDRGPWGGGGPAGGAAVDRRTTGPWWARHGVVTVGCGAGSGGHRVALVPGRLLSR